jgi:myosin heavy subunit
MSEFSKTKRKVLDRNNKQLENLISATIEQQNKNSKQTEKLLSSAIAKVQKSNEQFSTVMNTLEALKSENQALKTNHAALEKRNALLTAKVKENKGTIEQLQTHNSELVSANEFLKNEINDVSECMERATKVLKQNKDQSPASHLSVANPADHSSDDDESSVAYTKYKTTPEPRVERRTFEIVGNLSSLHGNDIKNPVILKTVNEFARKLEDECRRGQLNLGHITSHDFAEIVIPLAAEQWKELWDKELSPILEENLELAYHRIELIFDILANTIEMETDTFIDMKEALKIRQCETSPESYSADLFEDYVKAKNEYCKRFHNDDRFYEDDTSGRLEYSADYKW